jgi:hypothetical protein
MPQPLQRNESLGAALAQGGAGRRASSTARKRTVVIVCSGLRSAATSSRRQTRETEELEPVCASRPPTQCPVPVAVQRQQWLANVQDLLAQRRVVECIVGESDPNAAKSSRIGAGRRRYRFAISSTASRTADCAQSIVSTSVNLK